MQNDAQIATKILTLEWTFSLSIP